MKVRDIMTTEVVTLKVDEELSLASDIMTLARIRHLPIIEGDRLVGIISQRDLFKASLDSVMGYDYGEARDHLKTVTIKEVMNEEIITIGPDTEIHEAGQLLIENKIGCLPVIQGNALLGMVTETDILQFYVSRHQNQISGY
ncbi:MAG: CBS domain-containing protein [Candidatus Desulfatibia sp.]|uniref:CBS domain-containing protein n=1 Tax=Candidatus Desulfatibia sp. TaxID=3101189 RepID=UPI002F3364B0